MSDLSPNIPADCDMVILKTRFLSDDKFAGTEYNFAFKKLITFMGVSCERTIQSNTVRVDLLIPTEIVEKEGKPSLDKFNAFVKDWKREVIGDKWSEMDYHYTKVEANV